MYILFTKNGSHWTEFEKFETLQEAFDYIKKNGVYSEFQILKEVEIVIQEKE